MNTSTGMILIVAACVFVLVIGVLRRKAAFLLHFLVRMIIGGMAIYVTNGCLASAGIGLAVGLNIWNLFTVGCLGTGGFGLLYAILLYMNL
ncbi:MAG: pro-sigmaK processing inhibitor BofA family protein [bacterium]|nr:pro-sigmaK processing inhibitor BofA family protein [bacterium]MDY4100923.1 pro-sigmaK processing inhibitor BofA family protein [Lachnospiraceae bacterium]